MVHRVYANSPLPVKREMQDVAGRPAVLRSAHGASDAINLLPAIFRLTNSTQFHVDRFAQIT